MLSRIAYEHRSRVETMVYLLFIATMTINLFINSGRTGQFALALAMLVFIYLHYKLHWLKTLLIGLVVSITVFTSAYIFSPNFKKRGLETFNSINYAIENNTPLNDSTGQRFMMWQIASDIIYEHPIIGVGIGDERDSYVRTLTQKFPELHSTIIEFTDLHNTYLKIFTSTGIIGISLFIWIFYTLFKELEPTEELHGVGGVLIVLLLEYMFVGNFPAAYLTILFIFMISIVLHHPNGEEKKIA